MPLKTHVVYPDIFSDHPADKPRFSFHPDQRLRRILSLSTALFIFHAAPAGTGIIPSDLALILGFFLEELLLSGLVLPGLFFFPI